MIAPIVQQAYDKCAVTVTFKLADLHNGTAQTSWYGHMKPFELTDSKGKKFVVSCFVYLKDFQVNLRPVK